MTACALLLCCSATTDFYYYYYNYYYYYYYFCYLRVALGPASTVLRTVLKHQIPPY